LQDIILFLCSIKSPTSPKHQ